MVVAHVANEEMKVQRGQVTCLRPYDQKAESKGSNSSHLSISLPVPSQKLSIPLWEGLWGEGPHAVPAHACCGLASVPFRKLSLCLTNKADQWWTGDLEEKPKKYLSRVQNDGSVANVDPFEESGITRP